MGRNIRIVAFEPHLNSINNAFENFFSKISDVDFRVLKKPTRRKGGLFILSAILYRIRIIPDLILKYDLVHVNSAKFGIIAYIASFFGCKYIYTLHSVSTVMEGDNTFRNRMMTFLETSLIKPVARRAQEVFSISEYCRQQVLSIYGVDSTVIHNGYDHAVFSPGGDSSLQKSVENELKFLFVGKMNDIKKPANALRFFRHLCGHLSRQLHFTMVGEGEQLQSLKDTVEKDNVLKSKVTFIHKVDFKEIPAYYRSHEYLISACETEGFGLVVLEALGCNCIPLVPWKGAYPEILGNSVFAYDIDHLPDQIPAFGAIQSLRQPILDRFIWEDKVNIYYRNYKGKLYGE